MSENEQRKATPQSVKDQERRTVSIKATGGFTLPSGAQYLLQPGTTIEVLSKDAQYLIDNDLAE